MCHKLKAKKNKIASLVIEKKAHVLLNLFIQILFFKLHSKLTSQTFIFRRKLSNIVMERNLPDTFAVRLDIIC